ncbi:MAG: tRNA epoxyqueuosine(34) reductase QueG, partial [Methylococcales bacterium]
MDSVTEPVSDLADCTDLANKIKHWGGQLGFQKIGIADCDLSQAAVRLNQWLEKSFHGEMDYMQRHSPLRGKPEQLLPGTIRVISARMDYLPEAIQESEKILKDPAQGYISRYALGRDYHKLIRKRLQRLADKITARIGPFGYRAFTDSAPVLEKALAEKAGLGWIGKHTNLIDKTSGSWFFLGEIYTDLPLPIDKPAEPHCGTCTACIEICPTRAIVGPYQLDARRCISYLTIELKGPIPIEFRSLIGNRIYGCDDCQLVCPWNKFAKLTGEADLAPRNELNSRLLIEFFSWDEPTFLSKTEGSAIRRIGYLRWLRNITVALGNLPFHEDIVTSLQKRLEHPSALVREHVD